MTRVPSRVFAGFLLFVPLLGARAETAPAPNAADSALAAICRETPEACDAATAFLTKTRELAALVNECREGPCPLAKINAVNISRKKLSPLLLAAMRAAPKNVTPLSDELDALDAEKLIPLQDKILVRHLRELQLLQDAQEARAAEIEQGRVSVRAGLSSLESSYGWARGVFKDVGLAVDYSRDADNEGSEEKLPVLNECAERLAAMRDRIAAIKQQAAARRAKNVLDGADGLAGDPQGRASLVHIQRGGDCAIVTQQQVLEDAGVCPRTDPIATELSLAREAAELGFITDPNQKFGVLGPFEGDLLLARGFILAKYHHAEDAQLEAAEKSGRFLIVKVASRILWNNPRYGGNHSVLVTGAEVSGGKVVTVYINDSSGYPESGARPVPAEQFHAAWRAAGSSFVEIK